MRRKASGKGGDTVGMRLNLFEYKDASPVSTTSRSPEKSTAPNMYENYPFWFTFTQLGWRVVLSDPSTKKT